MREVAKSGTERRVFGAVLFAPVVIVFLTSQLASQWLFMGLAMLMVWEFARMHDLAMPLRIALIMDFALFALPMVFWTDLQAMATISLMPVVLALAGAVILFIGIIVRSMGSALFLAVLIVCILAGRHMLGMNDGHFMLLALGAMIAGCDVAAYFVGRQVGGRKLAPSISPNKTISGAVGGVVGSVVVAVLLRQLFVMEIHEALLLGVIVAGLAQIGDLGESALKRQLGVKDSSNIIPGHGGFLDRFDGYLLTLPAVYLYIAA